MEKADFAPSAATFQTHEISVLSLIPHIRSII